MPACYHSVNGQSGMQTKNGIGQNDVKKWYGQNVVDKMVKKL